MPGSFGDSAREPSPVNRAHLRRAPHDTEEAIHFVLEGELLMRPPRKRHHLHAGGMVHLPPLTPHGYRIPTEAPTRLVAWAVGPMDRCFAAAAESMHQLPRDPGVVQSTMAEHGMAPVA